METIVQFEFEVPFHETFKMIKLFDSFIFILFIKKELQNPPLKKNIKNLFLFI
jgi:hypothetical protein